MFAKYQHADIKKWMLVKCTKNFSLSGCFIYSYGGVKLQRGSSIAILMSKFRTFFFRCYGLNYMLLLLVGVAQSVGHLTRKLGVLGSIPGLATYFRFSFRFFKKDSCQLLAKVCARSTG